MRSRYFSLSALKRTGRGDLATAAALRDAVAARCFRNELILFAFDFCAVNDALSLVIQLRRVGFEHFLPLTDGPETCDTLQRAASARGVGPTPCYWSSWPASHEGWARWGSGPSCVSALRRARTCVPEQLWTTRCADGDLPRNDAALTPPSPGQMVYKKEAGLRGQDPFAAPAPPRGVG